MSHPRKEQGEASIEFFCFICFSKPHVHIKQLLQSSTKHLCPLYHPNSIGGLGMNMALCSIIIIKAIWLYLVSNMKYNKRPTYSLSFIFLHTLPTLIIYSIYASTRLENPILIYYMMLSSSLNIGMSGFTSSVFR
jgi:hypothetical protein